MTPLSATSILHKINNKDITVYEDLFDKYAAPMLGAIRLFIKDQPVSEKILEGLFLNLNLDEMATANECNLLIFMYKHTISFTVQSLKQLGISPDCKDIKKCPRVIQVIYEKQYSKQAQFPGSAVLLHLFL